jgi:hypothetical protein
MSDVCRESGLGHQVNGFGAYGVDGWGWGWVWMTLRRAGHVPAAGLWPRTLIIIYRRGVSRGQVQFPLSDFFIKSGRFIIFKSSI